MTTSLIIFATALVLCTVVLVNKKREVSGLTSVRFGNNTIDAFFASLAQWCESYASMLEFDTVRHSAMKTLHYVEKRVIALIEKAGQRFEVAGHLVMGRNIPKNRGSVSFFLKNIESRKKEGRID